jgi:hypothetical protein
LIASVLSISLLFRFLFEDVLNLLRTHAEETMADETILGQAEPVIEQQEIDSSIAGFIPASWIPSRAAGVMAKCRMQDFMGQDSRHCGRVERLIEIRVVVQRHHVGGTVEDSRCIFCPIR